MDIENKTYEERIEALLAKEKTARQENNHIESVDIIVEIIKTAFAHGHFDQFIELLTSLSKKRGQSKKAMIEMVKLAMSYVDQLQQESKMKLVEALKIVCDKKIYLEVEYARCCLLMVKHKEDEDNINEAARILQEVQVETYGSMEKREKIEFILYQMKIMLKKVDFVRLAIISKKLNHKNINEAGLEDLKIVFFNYIIILNNHLHEFKEVYSAYRTILDTVLAGFNGELPSQLNFGFNYEISNLLVNMVYYLVLSNYGEERTAALRELLSVYQSHIEGNRNLHYVIKMFLSTELIPNDLSVYRIENVGPFNCSVEFFNDHVKLFRKQLVQHNLRIFSVYYSEISLSRIQELLSIEAEEVEDELCELLVEKIIKGKIDRVDGFVRFGEKKNEKAVLNDWVGNLNSIFEIIDSTCNLIQRENEIYV